MTKQELTDLLNEAKNNLVDADNAFLIRAARAGRIKSGPLGILFSCYVARYYLASCENSAERLNVSTSSLPSVAHIQVEIRDARTQALYHLTPRPLDPPCAG